jgi:hypothetical protein
MPRLKHFLPLICLAAVLTAISICILSADARGELVNWLESYFWVNVSYPSSVMIGDEFNVTVLVSTVKNEVYVEKITVGIVGTEIFADAPVLISIREGGVWSTTFKLKARDYSFSSIAPLKDSMYSLMVKVVGKVQRGRQWYIEMYRVRIYAPSSPFDVNITKPAFLDSLTLPKMNVTVTNKGGNLTNIVVQVHGFMVSAYPEEVELGVLKSGESKTAVFSLKNYGYMLDYAQVQLSVSATTYWGYVIVKTVSISIPVKQTVTLALTPTQKAFCLKPIIVQGEVKARGVPVDKGQVTVKAYGPGEAGATVNVRNGGFTAAITLNKPGLWSVEVIYLGSDEHAPARETFTVMVEKAKPVITINAPSNVRVGDEIPIVVNASIQLDIELYVNDVYLETLRGGGVFTYIPATPGKYLFKAIVKPSECVEGVKTQALVEVSERGFTILELIYLLLKTSVLGIPIIYLIAAVFTAVLLTALYMRYRFLYRRVKRILYMYIPPRSYF